MTLPTSHDLYDVIDHTWPAKSTKPIDGWTIRQGAGGGSRVSATTGFGDVEIAEAEMRALGQPCLFMIRDGDDALDAQLAERGYIVKDPVTLYCAKTEQLATDRPETAMSFEVWPPLAVQKEVWEKGGIGPARLDVMDRAQCSKTSICGRIGEHPAGTAYVGIHNGTAMLHALETDPDFRRKGLGRQMIRAIAFWALENDADCLSLVVTRANHGANALYQSMGMTVVGHYHYRILPE